MPRNDGELVCPFCYPDLIVYGEVLPGWVLGYQEEAERDVPARHYVLFMDHETPLVWWPQEPVESTEDKFGRAEAVTWADDDPRSIQETRHVENTLDMDEVFKLSITNGHALYAACIKAGYAGQNSGNPLFWLVNRMARLIAAKG